MQKPKILVIDDDESVRNITAMVLIKMGNFAVLKAPGGREALEILHKEHVDLILTDMMMPGMNGLQTIEAVQQVWPEIPFIIMTAWSTNGLVKQALEKGATCCLDKPFDVNHLVSTVNQVVSSKESSLGKTLP
jgi:DNA-binding NtrC family response regulator